MEVHPPYDAETRSQSCHEDIVQGDVDMPKVDEPIRDVDNPGCVVDKDIVDVVLPDNAAAGCINMSPRPSTILAIMLYIILGRC